MAASVCALLILIAAIAAGTQLWAAYHLDRAQRDWLGFRLDEANRHLQLSLKIWPGSFSTNLLAARLARIQGDFQKAEAHLAACRKYDGMNEQLEMEWTMLRAQTGEFPELEARLQNWLEDRDSYLVLETLVQCLMLEGRYRLAHTYITKWLQQHPEHPGPYAWRAHAREQLGAANQARQDYTKAIELNPQLWQARVRLIKLLQDQLNFVEAEQHLQILEKTRAERPEVWLARAQSDLNRNDMQAAEAGLDRVLAAVPEHAQALYLKGKLAQGKGNPQQAESWFRRAVTASPGMLTARFALYQSLQQQPGREKLAAVELDRYLKDVAISEKRDRLLQKVEREPTNADALVAASEFLGKHGQKNRAEQFLRRALRLQPGHAGANNLQNNSVEWKK